MSLAEPDLFDTYPLSAGWKRPGTSQAAALAITSKSKTLRERVYPAILEKPDTPEGVAARLGEAVHSTRPRFSELSALNLIEDSGKRGRAMGGRACIVWAAVR